MKNEEKTTSIALSGTRSMSSWMVFLVSIFLTSTSLANPAVENIAHGNVTIQQTPTTTTVNQSSQKAIINWRSFNIGQGEHTHFQQPNGGVALNRISPNQGASQIYGRLTATGKIILTNSAGIFFGPSAYVNVGGLIASTADITDQHFLNNIYRFNQLSPHAGMIINQGTIIAADHGLVALMGNAVSNEGLIEANLGKVVLASGEAFTMTFAGNDLIAFTVDNPTTTASLDEHGIAVSDGVKNTGQIDADGGSILIHAKAAAGVLDRAINLDGIINANSVAEVNGDIVIYSDPTDLAIVRLAGEINAVGNDIAELGGNIRVTGYHLLLDHAATLNVSGNAGGGDINIGGNFMGIGTLPTANALYMASGASIHADALHTGTGGDIILWSDVSTKAYGNISARGGTASGNGGLIETSSRGYLDINGVRVDLSAPQGNTGAWLLDPYNVYITTSPTSAGSFDNGNPNIFTPSADDSNIFNGDIEANLATANVTITTTGAGSQSGDIYVNAAITWTSTNTLALVATNKIYLNAALSGVNGSLDLTALDTPQSITSGTPGSPSASGVTASVNVNNFNLLQGQWYQVNASLPSFTASNNFQISPGTQFIRAAGGDGASVNTALLINDVYGLQGMGSNATTGALNYKLNQNINASVTQYWNGGAGFMPIGERDGHFKGSLDGQNYTISNIYINRPGSAYQGLFNSVGGAATVSNLGLINSTVIAYGWAGALIGSNYGVINNVYATNVSVTGGTDGVVGGLFGASYNTITNAHTTGTITLNSGGSYFGGIVGTLHGNLDNSWSSATIYAPYSTAVGGLAGDLVNDKSITNSNFTGSVTGRNGVGGIVGRAYVGVTSIIDTYFDGTLTSTGEWDVGGIVGRIDGGILTRVHANGTITATGSVAAAQFSHAGIAGHAGTSTITDSYNLATVTANTVAYIGGIAGHAEDTTITNSYNLGNITGSYVIGGIAGRVSGTGSVSSSYSHATVTGLGSVDIGGLVGINLGTVSDSYSMGAVRATGTVIPFAASLGGLVGSNTGIIQRSYNMASVSSLGAILDTQARGVGGLVGNLWTDTARVIDSYNLGDVTANLPLSGVWSGPVGGLIGGIENGTVHPTIQNSYSTGRVINTSTGYTGAFVGNIGANGISIVNSFYDTETAIQSNAYGNNLSTATIQITGLTTAESMNYNTVSGIFGTATGTNNGGVTMSPSTTATAPDYSWFMVDGATRPILMMEHSTTIKNAHQLQMMTAALDADYTLANDIDLRPSFYNQSDIWGTNRAESVGKGFVSIGISFNDSPFTGSLNGQGNVIDNLYINRNARSSALFAKTDGGASISNIHLLNVDITNSNLDTAGLIGTAGSTSINNVSVTGNINSSGSFHLGGLIGNIASGAISIDNAYSGANIISTNTSRVGGLIGYISGSATDVDITNSYSTGNVSGNSDIGGLIGRINDSDTTITNSYSSGMVTGIANLGGLIGTGNTVLFSVINSFWDIDTSGRSSSFSSTNSAGYRGMSSIELMSYANLTNSANGFVTGNGWNDNGSTISNTMSTTAIAPNSTWFVFDSATRPMLMSEYSTNIKTPHQLQLASTALDANYTLSRDIDMSATQGNNDVWSNAGFVPIGISAANTFTGSLNGDNHAISNLYINRSTMGTGLISLASGSTIQNLMMLNATIQNNDSFHTGMIIGMGSDNIFRNLFLSGTINVQGGSLGFNNGGLIGLVFGSGTTTIDNIATNVSISGIHDYIGGLVGVVTDTALVNITNSYTSGSIYSGGSNGNAAGLVASIDPNATVNIINSYTSAAISGNNSQGLVGRILGTLNVTNSFWDTNATGQPTSAGSTGAAGYRGMSSVELSTPANLTNSANGFVTGNGWNDNSLGVINQDSTNTARSIANGTWYIETSNGLRPMLVSEFSTTIYTPHQLQLMSAAKGAYYSLANNIDLSATASTTANIWSSTQGFQSINTFTGQFDGDYRTIYDIYRVFAGIENGLFGKSQGIVKDINLVGTGTGLVAGHNSTGSLVGLLQAGVIVNSASTIPIQIIHNSSASIGGLIGSITQNGTTRSAVINSHYNGNIRITVSSTNGNQIGGLAGYNRLGSIINSSSSGIIKFEAPIATGQLRVGGLIGHFQGGLIDQSHSTTAITHLITDGGGINSTANQAIYIGGLVGESNLNSGSSANITNSYSAGSINLESNNFAGAYRVGGLLGRSDATGMQILNSHSDTGLTINIQTGGDNGTRYFGGLVGAIESTDRNVLLNQVYSTGNINIAVGNASTATGNRIFRIGGIIGYMNNQGTNTISNATNTGDILLNVTSTRSALLVGGIIGYLRDNTGASTATKLLNVANTGNINVNVTTHLVGNIDVGGILAQGSPSLLDGAYNTGNLTANVTNSTSTGGATVGGIIALFQSGAYTARNMYNTGNLLTSGTFSTATLSRVGGLIGRTESNMTVTNGYNIGRITGTTGGRTGAIIGERNNPTTFTNLFWDSEKVGGSLNAAGSGTQFGASGTFSTTLTTADTYTGFDFTNIWSIVEGSSYPYLKAFYPSTPRIIAGTTPAAANSTVQLAVNGVANSNTKTFADGSYYFLTGSNVISGTNNTIANGAAILTYLDDAAIKANAIAIAPASNGSLSNLSGINMITNAVTYNHASDIGTLDLVTLVNAKESLIDADIIPYSVSGNTLTIDSPYSLAFNIGSGATLTYNDIYTGSAGLTKAGLGTLALTNIANSYTGQTIINNGTLSVSKLANGGVNSSIGATAASTPILIGSATSGALVFTGGSDITNRQISIGSGGGTVQALNAGTLTLTGDINNSAGIITFNTNIGNIITGGNISNLGNIQQVGSGIYTKGRTISGTLPDAGAYTVALYANNTLLNSQSFSGTGQFSFIADIADSTPLLLTLTSGSNKGNTVFYTPANNASVPNVSITANTLNVGHSIAANAFSNDGFNAFAGLNDAGNILYTYNPGVKSLTLSNNSAFTTNAQTSYTLNGNIFADGNIHFQGAVIMGASAILQSNTGSVNAVTINTSASPHSLTINNATSSTISGAISGAGSLTKNGSGTLTLSASDVNTYAGATYINSGTLKLALTNSLPTTTALVTSGGTLDLDGYAQQVGSLNGATGSITSNNLTTAMLTNNTNGTDSYAGTISGALALIMNGGGSLQLSSANSYTGGTTLSTGTLFAGNNTSFGTSTLTINGGTLRTSTSGVTIANPISLLGNLIISGSNDFTLSGVISGASSYSLTKSGSNVITLSGENIYNGATLINAGTLKINHDAALGGISNGTSVASGATLDLNNVTIADETFTVNGTGFNNLGALTGTGTLSGNVTLGSNSSVGGSGTILLSGNIDDSTNSFSINKIGSGSLHLSAANSYNGGTILTSGILSAGNDNSFGTGTLTLNGGTLQSSANNITLANAIALGTSATIGGDTYHFTLSGNITGNNGLSKSGNSTITLSGTNIYDGLTTINGGTLKISNISGLGAVTSGTSVANGGTLELDGITNLTESISINGHGFNGLGAIVATGISSITSGITLNSNSSISTTGTLSLSGTITDGVNSFGLTKLGSGTLNVNAANSYDGGTTLAAGTLIAGNSASLGSGALALNNGAFQVSNAGINIANNISLGTNANLSGNNHFSLSGIISGANALNKAGNSIITLSGNNTYTGTTYINAGTLRASHTNALGTTAAGTIVADGATLDINTATLAAEALSLGGLGVGNAGALTGSGIIASAITLESNSSISSNGALTINGVISDGANSFGLEKYGSGSLSLTASNTYDGNTTISAGVLSVNSNASLGTGSVAISNAELQSNVANIDISKTISLGTNATISGSYNFTISGNMTGSNGLTKAGANTVTITGANTYTGTTHINAGTLALGANNSLDSGSALQVNGGTLALGAYSNTLGAVTLINGNITSSTGVLTGTSYNVENGSISAILGGSNVSLTKSTSGTVTLSGANTYTGTTTINAGTLQLGASNVIADNNSVTLANTLGATFNLNGYNDTIGLLAGGGLNGGNVLLGSATLTTGYTDSTYAGVISGTGGIIKQGSGIFTLSGANTYTGTTQVNQGQITLGTTNALPTSTALLIAGGTVNLNGYNQQVSSLNGSTGILTNSSSAAVFTNNTTGADVYSATISGALSLIKSGAGSLALSGSNSYTGTTAIQAGTLLFDSIANFGSNSALGAPTAGNSTITIAANSTLKYTGIGNHSTNRNISVLGNGGTIDASGTGLDLALNGGIAGNGNNIILTGTGSANLNSAITNANTITKNGTGTWTLSSNSNTYTGTATLTDGTLKLGITNALATNRGLIVSGGTFDMNNYSQQVASLNGSGGSITGNAVTLQNNTTGSDAYTGTINGIISLIKSGTGSFALSGLNSYTGTTTISDGILSFNTIANLGSNSALGAPSSIGNGTIAIASTGTLKYTGSGNNSSNRMISLSGNGATIDASGAGAALTLTGGVTGNGYSLNLTGSGAAVESGTLNNVSALTKSGTGTWTLSSTSNTNTGATNLNGGTLSINAASVLGGTTGLNFNGGNLTTSSALNLTPIITIGTNGGSITHTTSTLNINNTINGSGALSLGGTGSGITLNNTIGNSTPLTNLTVSIPLTVNGGSIETTGNQTYNNLVTLGNNTTFTLSGTGSKSMTFASGINGNHDVILQSTGTGNFSFNLTGALNQQSTNVIGTATGNNSLSVNSGSEQDWELTGVNSGTLESDTIAGNFIFSFIRNITGGINGNHFNLNGDARVTGTLDGKIYHEKNTLKFNENFPADILFSNLVTGAGTALNNDLTLAMFNNIFDIKNIHGGAALDAPGLINRKLVFPNELTETVFTGAGKGYINDPIYFTNYNKFYSSGGVTKFKFLTPAVFDVTNNTVTIDNTVMYFYGFERSSFSGEYLTRIWPDPNMNEVVRTTTEAPPETPVTVIPQVVVDMISGIEVDTKNKITTPEPVVIPGGSCKI